MKQVKLVPLYHQVYLTLKNELLSGRYAGPEGGPASALPGEIELTQLYGASRVTIRRALSALEDEGLVVRRHGAGTFAVPISKAAPFQSDLQNLYGDISESARGYEIEILEQGFGPTPAYVLAQTPGIGATSFHLSLLSRTGGKAAHINNQYIPERFARRIDLSLVGKSPLIVLLQQHGIKSKMTEMSLSATAADMDSAGKLGVAAGTPLISTRRVSVTDQDEPFEHFEALSRPDLYGYKIRYLAS